LTETGKLFANVQERNEGGQIPPAPNHYDGAAWLRRAPKSPDKVTSKIMGAPNFLLSLRPI